MAGTGKYVHLHAHSEYSLLDGANRIEKLVDRVKELGMGAVALTDHGNLFGALQFQKKCLEKDVKPIIGCEVYVQPTGRTDRTSSEARRNQHFVLLAETDEGYSNLARLTSLAYMEGFYYKPRIDKEILAEHSKGLIGLSACLKGVVSDYLMEDNMAAAERALDDFVQILGPQNFYMELMDHGIDLQKKVNDGILHLARKHGLPLVGTNDCHYLTVDDHMMHDVLLCIQTGKTLGEEKRMRMEQNEFYLKSPEQMIQLFGHLNGAISNTLTIAERCNGRIKTNQKLLPRYQPPDGKTEERYIRELAEEGFRKRYGASPGAAHRERLEYELQMIHQMGFDSYFLVVWDFINYAKSRGIPVGPGRGSGAGSIVAYCLDITDLCPIYHGLFFERFLNPERVSMPDFDIDFCFERRGEVIEYVKRKYGERNVAQIITFAQMKAKAAIHDVGRAMGMQIAEVDRVAKLVPERPPNDTIKKVTLQVALDHVPELKQIYDSEPQVKALVDNAMGVEGMVRHSSVHAAGVVISDQDLTRIIPLYMPANTKDLVTQWTMTEVEEVGLLKMDFLGLKTLTFVDKTIREIKRTRGIDIDWSAISIDEPQTYKLLASGDALGIFQLESGGMREFLTKLKPEKFSDVVALTALYRPGPMDNIPSFIARKHGKEAITYDHPKLEATLKETYGLIVYQEQVMQAVQVLAGFTLGQADILRRAMGKKKADEMAKQKSAFVEGCKKTSGIDRELAERLFDQIEQFAGYGFNKSHSAAYTVLTFQTAYLKTHYPVEFMAQLLTSEIGGSDEKLAAYMAECAARGIEVLPPDINESRKTFAVAGGDVRFGLVAIKNVGESTVEKLIEEREANGPFTSVQDFVARMPPKMVNSRVLECLIKCGAFDRFGYNRPSLIKAMPRIMEHAGLALKDADDKQASLFDMMSESDAAAMNQEVRIDRVDDWPEAEKLEIEKSLAGYYLSGHPLKRYKSDMAIFATLSAPQVKSLKKDDEVTWIGMIRSINIRTQKSDGRAFALVTAEDMEGALDLTFFADAFAKHRDIVREGKVIWVRATVNIWNDRVSLRVVEASGTDELRARQIKGIDLTMPARGVTEASLTNLRDIIGRHKGRMPVRIFLTGDDAAVAVEAGPGFKVKPGDRLIQELQDAKFEKKIAYRVNGNGHGE